MSVIQQKRIDPSRIDDFAIQIQRRRWRQMLGERIPFPRRQQLCRYHLSKNDAIGTQPASWEVQEPLDLRIVKKPNGYQLHERKKRTKTYIWPKTILVMRHAACVTWVCAFAGK